MSVFHAFAAVLAVQAQPGDPLAPLPPTTSQNEPSDATPAEQPRPAPPVAVVVAPRDWRGVFDAIRSSQWSAAQLGIATLPAGPLAPVAKAELYTAKGSPKVSLDALLDLLIEAPDLPKADQIQRMAEARGGIDTPRIAPRYPLVQIGAAPRRIRARPIVGEPEADRLRTDMDAYVKADDALSAEALFNSRALLLSPEARAEAAQRLAWIYYVRGEDANARRVADFGRAGATGEWAVQAAWVSGLAAWRQNDCVSSTQLFRIVGAGATEPSLRAGGLYWAARSAMACRRPAEVNPLMRAAANMPETFYGMLARRTLGMDTRLAPMPEAVDPRVEAQPNIRRALELARIGERDLAGQFLRFQARIGRPADQPSLVALARRLDLAATQHYLAHFGQPGARVAPAARYPRPNWTPRGGWRIDPALALAHSLQESSFRAEAISPAGAVGLMQVVPATMTLLARIGNVPPGDLRDPATNIEFGQRWIEAMRRRPETQGQLPKVIASYNAGSLPVGRWQVNDRGDPLLWMESVPYWETRFYVPTVLRNMWVYEQLAGQPTPTLTQMAQHKWPAFPVAQGTYTAQAR
ncbi:lytic transglycosylase domain-containing protein [Sphingomonas sp. BN140010]|uniref:Lytic transglycosylase domain-containing protein n=1 Tax=Sphingomonas arvum TaxID=2992113 RepID=A0ABT3JED9_9SPHN|nr:lytic transglycosylase domain-containing protein [Sphingomonas sp. BN140010]MCW3797435.1 lytic transglycosylase domain-containing protein [Sphingomonas sp. BN140010]